MAPTRDHKRVFDGDRGPNTGGMGAYTVDGMISPELESVILEDIVRPTIAGLSEEGIPYTGFLYFGLMLTADGPMVLEYNCRLGDPETQPLMMRMDFDLAAALDAAASRKLDAFKPAWKPGASVCVVMTSGGYPGPYETGKRIEGLAEASALPDVAVFHAGTKREGDSIVTAADECWASRPRPHLSNRRFGRPTAPWTKFILMARTTAPTSEQRASPNRALPEMYSVAEVLHLFQAIARGEPVREFDEVFAVENKGFRDCLHGRKAEQAGSGDGHRDARRIRHSAGKRQGKHHHARDRDRGIASWGSAFASAKRFWKSSNPARRAI